MDAPRPGGCLCGRVRYRLRGEPLAFYVCHCTDCQRASGSAFGLSMIVAAEAVEHETEIERVTVELPGARTWRWARCAPCGTRVWGEPPKYPQVRTVRPGTLDDPHAFQPWGNIWTSSAQPWVRLAPGPCFERQPEDPLAMVRAWRERPAR
jgi:hypothetical protein